jgi:hypothetical protein
VSAPSRPALPVLALLASVAACSDPTGLRVDIDLGSFQTMLSTLAVTISALPGGFAPRASENNGGVTISVEDRNGDQVPDLVLQFSSGGGVQFGKTLSFRVATGNHADLMVDAEAVGADSNGVTIAGGGGTATLPGNGRATIDFALQPQMGPVTPDTVTTDLATAGTADIVITGPHKDARLATAAVCNLDGNAASDLVLGLPGAAQNPTEGPSGAVWVIFDAGAITPTPASLDLASLPPGTVQFHVYGTMGGDQLGAAIACADLDGDAHDDLILGAPGAERGAGAVYVIQGSASLANTGFDLTKVPPAAGAPAATWVGGGSTAKLGSALYAANLDGDSKATAEVLIAAPGEADTPRVHLLAGALVKSDWNGRHVLDGMAPAHVTFTGIAAASIGAGDLDGSGYPLDIILGNPDFEKADETTPRGAAYVFPAVAPVGSQIFDPSQAKLALVGDLRSQMGAAVLALDTQATGNGVQDLVVGAPGDANAACAVHVYTTSDNIFKTPMRDPDFTLSVMEAEGRFGSALAGATTIGGTRLFVGAPTASHGGRPGAGAAYVFRGDRSRPVLVEQIFGATAGDGLGAALAGGDIGSTAVSDVIVVAPSAAGKESGAGAAYVRYGR